MEHPLPIFRFAISFLVLDIILLGVCVLVLPSMPSLCELPVISLVCVLAGCVMNCLASMSN